MKICYFGIYDREYSRNKILISGLIKNNVEVFECVSRKKGISKYYELIKKHQSIKNKYDVMIVGYPGFQAMLLAKLVTEKPIIFDAFVSIYDSMVLDRAQVKRNSLKARYFWWLDKLSLTLAHLVLFDTQEHITFVSKEFKIKTDKFRRIFVGADTEVFYPTERKQNDLFKVSFYGHFIPLQGVEHILDAAKILEDDRSIVFEIIGDGQEKKKILSLAKELNLKNINFFPNLPLVQIAEKMRESDVCLGIFGSTAKAQRVIPNKVYECVALRRPVITGDTPAVRELFDESELFLVPVASGEFIAKAINMIKVDKEQALVRAQRANNKFNNTVSVLKLGLELKDIVDSVIQK